MNKGEGSNAVRTLCEINEAKAEHQMFVIMPRILAESCGKRCLLGPKNNSMWDEVKKSQSHF